MNRTGGEEIGGGQITRRPLLIIQEMGIGDQDSSNGNQELHGIDPLEVKSGT